MNRTLSELRRETYAGRRHQSTVFPTNSDKMNLYDFLYEVDYLKIVSFGASGAMVFGGVVPYIPQYRSIQKTENADGFSTYVCLALLVANILRILFWFGKHYELPLLAQSIIMIIAMMAMLHLCTKVKALTDISTKRRAFTEKSSHHALANDESPARVRKVDDNSEQRSTSVSATDMHIASSHRFLDFDTRQFWKWNHFSDYVQFVALFSFFCGAITILLMDFPLYIETLGFMAVFTEAMLGAPQFYKNLQNRSTIGMSVKMVLFWLSGDTFKTGYFLVKNAPIQFTICGALQVSIDIAILWQVWHYRGKKPA